MIYYSYYSLSFSPPDAQVKLKFFVFGLVQGVEHMFLSVAALSNLRQSLIE